MEGMMQATVLDLRTGGRADYYGHTMNTYQPQYELKVGLFTGPTGKCALKLVARGWITRCWGTNVAVEIEHHEFRIQSSRQFMPA